MPPISLRLFEVLWTNTTYFSRLAGRMRTVSPGGTAFTGLENVVPMGTIALVLVTGGSGLLWAGSRRRRHEGDDEA